MIGSPPVGPSSYATQFSALGLIVAATGQLAFIESMAVANVCTSAF